MIVIILIPIWIVFGYFTLVYFNLVNNQINTKHKLYYNKVNKLVIILIWPISILIIKLLDYCIEDDYELT